MTVPRHMQAAILVKQKEKLIIDTVELPEILDVGQVMVKILYSGICGSQLGEINGIKGEDKYLPHLLGHEGTGEVLETGPGVTTVKPGDTVVLHWRKGEGIEARPPVYSWKGKPLNAGFVTTFNEYAVVSENRITPIDKGMDLKQAVLYGCAVTTGMGVVVNNAKIKPGESVVVFGAGGVGLNVIQGARMVSAYPLVAIDLYDSKLELARSIGASHTLNINNCNIKNSLEDILGRDGADVVIDNTGKPDVIVMAMEATNPQGRTILVGVTDSLEDISFHPLPLFFGKKLTGSHGGESYPPTDIPKYARLQKAGQLNLGPLLTDEFPLSEINTAIEKMRHGDITGRCLITMNPSIY